MGSLLRVFAIALALQFLKKPTRADPAAESVPKFERDLTWPKPLPNKWITGQIPGIAVDSLGGSARPARAHLGRMEPAETAELAPPAPAAPRR